MKGRKPSERDVKKLFGLSRNRCAFPGCTMAIVQMGVVTGEICHIKARSPEGPRHDLAQPEKERHAFANLILLCNGHQKLVDSDPTKYTVEALAAMKMDHERCGIAELSPNDVDSVRRLLKSYVPIVASGEAQVMVATWTKPISACFSGVTVARTNRRIRAVRADVARHSMP